MSDAASKRLSTPKVVLPRRTPKTISTTFSSDLNNVRQRLQDIVMQKRPRRATTQAYLGKEQGRVREAHFFVNCAMEDAVNLHAGKETEEDREEGNSGSSSSVCEQRNGDCIFAPRRDMRKDLNVTKEELRQRVIPDLQAEAQSTRAAARRDIRSGVQQSRRALKHRPVELQVLSRAERKAEFPRRLAETVSTLNERGFYNIPRKKTANDESNEDFGEPGKRRKKPAPSNSLLLVGLGDRPSYEEYVGPVVVDQKYRDESRHTPRSPSKEPRAKHRGEQKNDSTHDALSNTCVSQGGGSNAGGSKQKGTLTLNAMGTPVDRSQLLERVLDETSPDRHRNNTTGKIPSIWRSPSRSRELQSSTPETDSPFGSFAHKPKKDTLSLPVDRPTASLLAKQHCGGQVFLVDEEEQEAQNGSVLHNAGSDGILPPLVNRQKLHKGDGYVSLEERVQLRKDMFAEEKSRLRALILRSEQRSLQKSQDKHKRARSKSIMRATQSALSLHCDNSSGAPSAKTVAENLAKKLTAGTNTHNIQNNYTGPRHESRYVSRDIQSPDRHRVAELLRGVFVRGGSVSTYMHQVEREAKCGLLRPDERRSMSSRLGGTRK